MLTIKIILTICAVAITAAIVYMAIQAVRTLKQFENTGKAVEYLALNADSKLEALEPIVKSVKNVSDTMNSAWFKGASMVYSLISKVSRKK